MPSFLWTTMCSVKSGVSIAIGKRENRYRDQETIFSTVSKLKNPKDFSNVTVHNKGGLRSKKMPSENRPCNWLELKKPSCRLSLFQKREGCLRWEKQTPRRWAGQVQNRNQLDQNQIQRVHCRIRHPLWAPFGQEKQSNKKWWLLMINVGYC